MILDGCMQASRDGRASSLKPPAVGLPGLNGLNCTGVQLATCSCQPVIATWVLASTEFEPSRQPYHAACIGSLSPGSANAPIRGVWALLWLIRDAQGTPSQILHC